MKIHAYERIILGLTVLVELAFLGAILLSVTQSGIVLPAPVQRVDPQTAANTPPWDQPGVTEVAPGQFEVVMRAQGKSWQFEPAEVKVPAGAAVTFRIVSEDVIHGFKVVDTNVNVMVIPGQVSVVKHTFNDPGEYEFLCHEYCGVGHQAMFGKIIVGETAAAQAGVTR